MFDLFNFKDSLVVVSHYWLWMVAALVLGVIIGWWSNEPDTTES